MGKTSLKMPCSNPVNTNIIKEIDCWQIECNNGKIVVALDIDYINDNKNFVGLIDVEDAITGEVFMIPMTSISIIKMVKLISVKFYCVPKNRKGKETDRYICHYTIPHCNEYAFDDYGQKPIQWTQES